MAEKKISKTERYNDIKALLRGEPVSNGTTVDEAITVIDHEIELIKKKNSARSNKQTQAQEENEIYRALIMEFLATKTEPVTCSEIQSNIPDFSGFNNQKIASLMTSLKETGKVNRNTVKGKAVFSIA